MITKEQMLEAAWAAHRRIQAIAAPLDNQEVSRPHGIDDQDLAVVAAAHLMGGRMSNGPAWRLSNAPEMVSWCACGRSFYGRNVTHADAQLTAHQQQVWDAIMYGDAKEWRILADAVEREREP